MFSDQLMFSVLLLAMGFAIFLLSNLQKSFLIKMFGWFIAVLVMIFGFSYLTKTVGWNMFGKVKNKITSEMQSTKNKYKKTGGSHYINNVLKETNINQMFDEVK